MPALTAASASALDAVLLSPRCGFSLLTLVELAGQAVALATLAAYPPSAHPRVLVVCGSGNQGLDGLAAARWLATLSYAPHVALPRPPARAAEAALSASLRAQFLAAAPGAAVLGAVPPPSALAADYDVIVDALFGFSFVGPPRPPLAAALEAMIAVQRGGGGGGGGGNASAVDAAGAPGRTLPIVSVDIPSGWHVELGDEAGGGLRPDALVSLSAPKLCSSKFSGAHFLGGRFVPAVIAEEFEITEYTNAYTGGELVARLS